MTSTLRGPLLAIDTSTPTSRVALLGDAGQVLAEAEATAARSSSVLLGLLGEILARTGASPQNVSAIACGAGPGSFTGLRVGLAVCKGLALVVDAPFVAIPSLDALAWDLAAADADTAPAAPDTVEARLLLPCLDAGKGELHAALYRRTTAGGAAAIARAQWRLPPAALADAVAEVAAAAPRAPLLIGGPGAKLHVGALLPALGSSARLLPAAGPSAASIGRLAMARLARGERDDVATAVPLYGRPPDITKPGSKP